MFFILIFAFAQNITGQNLIEKFDALYYGHYQNLKLLEDFDKELQKSPEVILNSKIYEQTVAAWRVHQELSHEIASGIQSVQRRALSSPARDPSTPVFLKWLARELESPNLLQKFALEEVKKDMNLSISAVSLRAQNVSAEDVEKEILDFKRLKANLERLKPDESKLWKEKFQAELASIEMAKTNKKRHFPSPDSSGNLTGSSFPKNHFSLTFDDGPHPSLTRELLDILDGSQVKASFFVLASKAKSLPHVMADILARGHEPALHSYTHPQLTKLSESQLQYEISTAKSHVQDVWGISHIDFFRCPYGACGGNGSRIRQKIASENMLHVFWTVDTLDWKDKDPASVLARTLQQMRANGKGIILFHDIHPQTIKAVRMLLEQNMDVNWITLGQYLDLE